MSRNSSIEFKWMSFSDGGNLIVWRTGGFQSVVLWATNMNSARIQPEWLSVHDSECLQKSEEFRLWDTEFMKHDFKKAIARGHCTLNGMTIVPTREAEHWMQFEPPDKHNASTMVAQWMLNHFPSTRPFDRSSKRVCTIMVTTLGVLTELDGSSEGSIARFRGAHPVTMTEWNHLSIRSAPRSIINDRGAAIINDRGAVSNFSAVSESIFPLVVSKLAIIKLYNFWSASYTTKTNN